MVGKKNSSKYRKKRRGFGGQRRQEIEREDNGENRNESMTSDVGPSTSTPVKTADEANRSLEKISTNCPIFEKERSQVLTRKRAKSLGFGINDAGVNTLRGCRWLNNQRLINAAQKCKSKYLNQRRLLRRKTKECTKTGQDYLAGGFSIHKVPDCPENKKKAPKNKLASTGDTGITFVN
eukprot:gene9928-18539_t